jgi:hypothetical protein
MVIFCKNYIGRLLQGQGSWIYHFKVREAGFTLSINEIDNSTLHSHFIARIRPYPPKSFSGSLLDSPTLFLPGFGAVWFLELMKI